MTIMNDGIPAAIGACATVALCGLIITVAVSLLLMLWNLLRDAHQLLGGGASPQPARRRLIRDALEIALPLLVGAAVTLANPLPLGLQARRPVPPRPLLCGHHPERCTARSTTPCAAPSTPPGRRPVVDARW